MASDREVWEQICHGDARAFESFYHENAPRLQAFLRRLLGTAQAAEDVAQDTFLQLWKQPNGFRSDASLRAYLFGIAKKQAAEWWRQRRPTMEANGNEADRPRAETCSLIEDAFARLDVDQRSLLWLREVEGQSYADLAEILAIPIGTVRSRLAAARQQLRHVWHHGQVAKKETT